MAYLGAFLGAALIVIAMAVDLLAKDLRFTFESIEVLYTSNPTHWIILTSPFFLTMLFYSMGKMIGERELKIEQQLQREKDQFIMLERYIAELENGNYTASVSLDFENRTVAAQLEHFRDKLLAGKSAEERRAWENHGLASFGTLLHTVSSIDRLSEEVIRYIVKYLSCNQGAVYILNDHNEDILNLKACYAFDRRKFVSQTIGVGQGLVGQCFLEKETVILYDVPQNYIKITSGLGMANPGCIAIVPVKHNNVVTGVIEVASFHRLEEYQIIFLEKVAEAFASVVLATRSNQDIKRLLEESQVHMEALRSQEEEMRQNLEELQSVQEQMVRQLGENAQVKKQLEAREKVLGLTTILSESDLYGTITFVNERFCEVSQYSADELIGQAHNFVRHPDMPAEIFERMWKALKRGQPFQGIIKNKKKDGTHYWVDATIVPVVENGKIVKYIGARYYLKDDTHAQRLFFRQLEALGLLSQAVG
jgi:PAS domain S-box-containing protein